MSKVSSIVSAAVPWVLGVFGVPPLVAEGAGVVAAGVDTVVEAGKASAARNRELQAFVAKAAESFEEQCGREITHLGDYDREVVEKRMRELLQAADRDAMLGAALIGYDEFQLRLFGTEACAGLDDDGRGYLVALCGHVHGLVLSFAQSDAVLGVASTTAIRIIWRELASRPTLDQVQLLIRQAISGEVEKRRHVVGSRPRLAAGFVTRNEMPALRDALDQSGVATVSALQGMRGAGKSQLASAYAEACENDLWRFVGWITASTREQAITELAAAAQSTGISDEEIPEKAARQLLAWLSSAGPEPRLLVFDNVNSADDVTDLIPTGPGMRVIVTTTRKATALGKPVEIGVYTPQQAIDYLQDATDVRDEEGAGAVAEDLGRLPVALTQAAVVIKGRNYDFRRYRELLSSGRGLDRVVETEDGAYPQLVGVALRLAYTDVLKGLPGEVSDAAEHVLGALALLAEPGVPREWLRGLGDDEFVVDETVGALVKNSILIESEDRRIVSLHRLQAQVIREDFEARNEMGAAVRNACVAMHGASWYVANTYLVERDNNREIASQFVAVREQSHSTSLMNDEDWMRLVAAVVYRSSQQLDPYPAIELEGYLEDVNRVLGADCREALMFCNNLGVVYELVGDLGRARLFYERALDGLSKVTGADQSDVLAARNNLAGVYLSSGNLTQAASMLERVVCDAKRVFGERHPDTLMFRGNLAKAYEAVGDLSRASVLFDRLTEDTSRILGSGDQRTFTARSGLARAYRSKGDWGRAISLNEELMRDCQQILGPDHPRTVRIRDDLATMYEAAGQFERAISLHARALWDSERILGVGHPVTLTCRNNLAYAYESAGDLDRAFSLYEQTLLDRERLLGLDHPSTLVSCNNLAGLYQAKGEIGKAVSLYKRTLGDRERFLGADHPDTLISLNNLAGAYRAAGNLVRAVRLYERGLDECGRVLGKEHATTLGVWRNLADTYGMIGRWREAFMTLEEAVKVSKKAYGAEHPITQGLLERRDAISRMGVFWVGGDH